MVDPSTVHRCFCFALEYLVRASVPSQETLKSVSKQLKSSYAAYLARKSEVADLNQAFEVRCSVQTCVSSLTNA